MVDALHIHIEDPIPVFLRHHTHQSGHADPGVADQNIHRTGLCKGGLHLILAGYIGLNGDGACLLRQRLSHGGLLLIEKPDPVTGGAKPSDGGSTDTARSTGYHYIRHKY